MAIVQAVANSFKKEILEGGHELQSGGDVFKLALYASNANLSAATTSFTTSGEHGNTGQYTSGGGVLTGQQTWIQELQLLILQNYHLLELL